MTIGRTFRTIALGAVITAGLSGPALAQTPAAPQPPRAAPERAERMDRTERMDSAERMDSVRHRIARGRAMRARPQARRAMAQRMHMQRDRMMDRARRGGWRGNAALMRDLDLTDAQRANLRALRERYRAQSADIMRAARPDSAMLMEMRTRRQDAMRDAAQLRERETAEIRALLTPEQQGKFDANREQVNRRLERMREGATREGRGRIARPNPAPGAGNR